MADILWSFSTTIRNPERITSFFKTIVDLEGEEWNEDNQIRFQVLLIKNRFYKPTSEKLNNHQIAILDDPSYEMSEEEAKDIFDSKGYVDPAMRGRTSFDPLEKVGLVSLINNVVTITSVGRKYLDGEIEFGDVFFNALIKQQYPCPLSGDNTIGYDIKPFIAVLHIIKGVNERWQRLGNDPVGISREEFGIFCLNLKRYTELELVSDRIVNFRRQVRTIIGQQQRKQFIDIFTHEYLRDYPSIDTKLTDYRDNMLRCLRLTKLIYIRGNGYYIDLEPRRNVEITRLLEADNASSRQFDTDEWNAYIGSSTSYTLPWETPDSLRQIQLNIIVDIRRLEQELNIAQGQYDVFDDLLNANNNITNLRKRRLALENDKNKIVYSELDKALEVAGLYEFRTIKNCVANRPCVELERMSTLALTVIDDALLIKPNYPVGDDNEPTWTAPAEVPDIECFYEDFNMICEVTLLSRRDQWISEGQPVMRHLRDFEDCSSKADNYCLFIAPTIHQDTMNTFWYATKYDYDGRRQKIIPISISQMHAILEKVAEIKENGRRVYHNQLRSLLEACTSVNNINSFSQWRELIDLEVENWINSL